MVQRRPAQSVEVFAIPISEGSTPVNRSPCRRRSCPAVSRSAKTARVSRSTSMIGPQRLRPHSRPPSRAHKVLYSARAATADDAGSDAGPWAWSAVVNMQPTNPPIARRKAQGVGVRAPHQYAPFVVLKDTRSIGRDSIRRTSPVYRSTSSQTQRAFGFRPIESSRSRSTGGVGLGLAIANRIGIAHDGRLISANRAPHGLRATITLQMNDVPRPARAATARDEEDF